MEQLLNDELALAATRKFTDFELRLMRKNLSEAIFKRMCRRNHVMGDNITSVMIQRLTKAFAEAGYSNILGQDIRFSYCPAFVGENYKNPEKDGPKMNYPHCINIWFNYGEQIVAKEYIEDDEAILLLNTYRMAIKDKNGNITISIIPPAHLVEDPPFKRPNFTWKISKSAKIKWILGQTHVSRKQQCGIPNCIIKSPLTTTDDRRRIYGVPLLKAIVDFFITNKMAATLMEECHSINLRYHKHFIAGAQAATMCFLMIGRFCPRALSGLSDEEQINWNYDIPMDVTRLIAKHVWDSRYQNEIWGTDTRTILAIEPDYGNPPEHRAFYDEDHYWHDDRDGRHGWVPWFKPKARYVQNGRRMDHYGRVMNDDE